MPTSILLFGHSQAARLSEYLRIKGVTNFDMSRSMVDVRCEGSGGLKIRHLLNYDSEKGRYFENVMNSFEPQILILFVGDNDIDSHTDGEQISGLVQDAISALKEHFPFLLRIIISQILPRHSNRYVDAVRYNSQASVVNSKLHEWAKVTARSYCYFQWCKFVFPSADREHYKRMKRFYLNDGVHLKPAGYHKLFMATKHTIKSVLKRLG